jgi:hypothetical protein
MVLGSTKTASSITCMPPASFALDPSDLAILILLANLDTS